MKGVVITAENQGSLGQQYHADPDDFDDLIPIGYILIADFGGDWVEAVVTQATFDSQFLKGALLENDYFIVTAK